MAGWFGDRLEQYPLIGIALDPAGQAGALLDDLAKVVPAELIEKATAHDHARAAASLLTAIEGGKTLRHRGQPSLDAAAEAARERKLGDAWAWTRLGATVPISPLVVVTLARWAFRRAPAPEDTASVYASRGMTVL